MECQLYLVIVIVGPLDAFRNNTVAVGTEPTLVEGASVDDSWFTSTVHFHVLHTVMRESVIIYAFINAVDQQEYYDDCSYYDHGHHPSWLGTITTLRTRRILTLIIRE